MKRTLLALLLLCMILPAGGCAQEEVTEATPTPEPTVRITPEVPSDVLAVEVDVPLRYESSGNDTFIELAQFKCSGELPMDLQNYNQSRSQWYNDLIKSYGSNHSNWVEVKTYPITTSKYISVVEHINVYPSYGTDGLAYSIVYDIAEQRSVPIEEAYTMAGTSQEAIENDCNAYCSGESRSGAGIQSIAFWMQENSRPQFVISYCVHTEGAGDWIEFYSWTDGRVEQMPLYMFEPELLTSVDTGPMKSQIYRIGQYNAGNISDADVKFAMEHALNSWNISGMKSTDDLTAVNRGTCLVWDVPCCQIDMYFTKNGSYRFLDTYYIAQNGAAVYGYNAYNGTYYNYKE